MPVGSMKKAACTGALLLGLLWIPACASTQTPGTTAAGGSPGQPGAVASPTSRSVLEGVYSARQANRGEQIFQQNCSACHSTREFGVTFQRRWAGGSVGDIFDFISATMPQSSPGSLSAEEYAAIIGYFLRINNYPAGEADLESDIQRLKQVNMVLAQ